MKPRSILSLVRDIGAGNVVVPVMEELRARGHKTLLLAEEGGKAKEVLLAPFTVVNDRTTLLTALRSFCPDIVISGLSSPRVLEEILDKEALHMHLPLVHMEDYWGCHVRSPYEASVYVTVDAMAKRLLMEKHPGVRIAIAGIAGISPKIPHPKLVEKMQKLRRRTGAKVIVYPDGGPECEEALPMLVESILRSGVPIVLVSKPHPKSYVLPHPKGGSWGQWLKRELSPLCEKDMVADFAESSDEEVADCADGVVGSYGHIIMRPVVMGKLALTLWTPAIRKSLRQETGLDATPLMLHRFPVLEQVQPLDDFLQGPYPTLDLKPYDVCIATDAVLSLCR